MAEILDFPRSTLPHFPDQRRELATMRLLEAQTGAHRAARATLIVAPYAAHDAEIADFAPGHSLAGVLLEAGAAPLALTAWKSATPAMRDFGIDAYLADLDAAVEHLGGRVALVGLCQGGWLGALYAARFPEKVARLALVGAPLDLKAAESAITRALAWTPSAFIAGAVALSGGRVLGASSFALWAPGLASEYEAAVALQCEPDAALRARYDAWLARRIDLPGRYFLETTEWLFRGNDLAENRFPALGRLCGLGHLTSPVYALAAAGDALVAPEQTTAVTRRCPRAEVIARIVAGRHLSLFMGRRTLAQHWPALARWLLARNAARRRRPA
jgi:poly(3-hydroxyalkanoate) synthetase